MPEVADTLLVTSLGGDEVWNVRRNSDGEDPPSYIVPAFGDVTIKRRRIARRISLSWLWVGLDTPAGTKGATTPVSTAGMRCTNYQTVPTGDGIHCRYTEIWVDESAAYGAWQIAT